VKDIKMSVRIEKKIYIIQVLAVF